MLLQVGQFRQRVRHDMDSLIDELQDRTGRYGEAEVQAWRSSLPALSRVLDQPDLERFHIHVGKPGSISVEYRLPASSSWCDAVLLGAGPDAPSAVMIELKDWYTDGDRPGDRPGLIRHKGSYHLHPAEQVRGYVEYCRRFHSTVQEAGASVDGCAFFTRSLDLSPYRADPHRPLVSQFPVFSSNHADLAERFPEWLARRLVKPEPGFARAFEQGVYRQDRSFVRQVARTIAEPAETQFVLLDAQRHGFELCMQEIEGLLARWDQGEKAVVVIEGPPGSGKSVLAAHLWSALIRDDRIDGSVVLTTTSGSQRSNWEHLFGQAAGGPAGHGLVMPANRYNPGLSPVRVNKLKAEGHRIEIETWRENLELVRQLDGDLRMPDDSFAVSIIDEAHALIDPTVPGKRGVSPSGWQMHAGPQSWHIMRASRLSIFLMDADQSYRDNETTSSERIRNWASDHGVEGVQAISLGDAQFRCGGSKEYVEWVDHLLGLGPEPRAGAAWRALDDEGTGSFRFEVMTDPQAVEDALRSHVEQGDSARLLASYGRKWVTKKVKRPHLLAPEKMDFHIPYTRDGRRQFWSKPWNYAPGQDYTLFVQAPFGSPMHEDPLCEVGCPYVVRGFDYDWIGLIWLDDLVWRDERWQANLGSVYETAWNKTRKAAKDEAKKGISGEGTDALVERLARGYRILLSRAMKGVYVWFEDEETRRHVEAMLEGASRGD